MLWLSLMWFIWLIGQVTLTASTRLPESARRSNNLKILGLFPHPGKSHFHFFHPIMRGLAEKGHEVTVLSHFPDKSPPVGYHDIPLTDTATLTNSVDLKMFENRPFYNHLKEFFHLYEWGKNDCNKTLRSNGLAEILHQKKHYDVILVEQFNSDCMLGAAHTLNAPVIGLSSCAMMPWYYERMGSPIIPSYIPALFVGVSEKMTLIERLSNWLSFHILNLLYKFYSMPTADSFLRYKFGSDMPSVKELGKNVTIMFINQHFSLSGAKPVPPSIIELGGIHIQKPQPLDSELQKFLDNAKHGVIFISWGSMIRAETLPPHKRDGIIKAVKRLKQHVIWKWENDTLINKPDNMFIRKWLPQREILCHPNVKVFMTHAGLMGSSEAAYCGVPVIATPMYGDQFLNAAAMIHRGMGLLLTYEDINENNVIKALKKIQEKEYADNAKAVSYSYKHRPQSALETAIWWVEYVANTKGGQLLKSHAIHMTRFSYYCLDIYLILISAVIIIAVSWKIVSHKINIHRNDVKKVKAH